jgi:2-oxoglutarate ferredoxin oxidoreductase subunit alpha
MGGIEGCAQDYFYAVKGLGAGGGRAFVISPSTVQEAVDYVYKSFDIADEYRALVIVLTDKLVSSTIEAVELPPMRDLSSLPDKSSWLLNTRDSMDPKDKRYCQSMVLPISAQEEINLRLNEKYKTWEKKETQWEEYLLEDAEIILFSYGSVGRIAKASVNMLRADGVKAGLFRPITLFPFPEKQIRELDYSRTKRALCVEMAVPGQFVEDVERSVKGRIEVAFYGRSGGVLVKPDEIATRAKALLGGN